MISRVRGVLMHKDVDRAEIATPGGVTYELLIPSSSFESLPRVGREVELYAALIGREDGIELYGFGDELERQLFLRLQSASGVGPRLALTMLGAMSTPHLVEAIRGRDLARLCTVSGVGRKKAERIALELGDKLDDMVTAAAATEPESAAAEAAINALVALGYSRSEAEAAVRGVLKGADGAERDVESLVREALAGLS
ncbi:MAG: Holliday junction branch migration protein RuvA [Gemmatimonadetes bacterium]|uniref:Holliday junction branch migration complex subunit RuvA n=1 Tax=Candidatus Kutchimonas denitrificans TaxID=3056748 RepID=A0AAE4Z915_9BACT|nr:Holliday junction branch migration protein RuvA [Gemmatimonadota bacterium]NIR75514.1 Holliday junction branch migration protein RuvA [Candidatus Kutchimonas denitrificans]NIS01828.1 Holliday junction branch migration protein RuvA [Gemmatimonadota bacterium]NIT67609.1 Holliday junction branch migration protein RuvA [Gemmatimonadota bacterium]NIU53483.1 Holliday junction branch migration protein RuvA [Gemmatimonadota bacterium]